MSLVQDHRHADLLLADPWLSGVIGYSAARVRTKPHSSPAEAELRGAMEALASDAGSAFVDAKLPAGDVASLVRFQQAGMRVVDVNVTLQLKAADVSHSALASETDDVEILDPHDNKTGDAIVDVSANAFSYSRFHLDPGFDRSVADRIKAEWAANAVQGRRGDRVYVGFHKGQVAGFLIALHTVSDENSTAIIDLIAVDASARGQGLARCMTTAFLRDYHSRCDRFRVGTQLANLPAMCLYQSMGFVPCQSSYVLHAHIPANGDGSR